MKVLWNSDTKDTTMSQWQFASFRSRFRLASYVHPLFAVSGMHVLSNTLGSTEHVSAVAHDLYGPATDFYGVHSCLDACIRQSYFIHGLSFMESSVLLGMSLDCYIAICNPLRYSSILTASRIIKIGIAIIMRSFLFITPAIIRLKFFNYCKPHILSHSFCLHQDLLRLTCSDIRFNSFYALGLVICTLLLDSVLILVSYVLILKSVLAIASQDERLKSFQTCVSHICSVLVFYIPIISLTMVHHFGKHLSPIVHVLMGNIYILFPPLMNPIIYSVKTQQIRNRIQRLFLGQRY
ncbi:olfactory receptor 51V1-like [Macrotis lagotis]|uniref:olfactory receptor 51V1-like n=1 Tax=Macrotis lagotis TaxID=92651 RepID=UPI003D6979EF